MMVVSNSEEIAEAIELAKKDEKVTIPEKETAYTDFLFDPNNVSLAYKDTTGDIRIIHSGQDLSLQWDEKVFKGLEKRFNKRK